MQNRVVASSGGGKVGADLLASCIQAVNLLPGREIELRVFIGPFMEEKHVAHLKLLASADSRIKILPFSNDFLTELASACLSISMAGYNTCMDVLSSGVKALVYPFSQNREQGIRAVKLEQMGMLHMIKTLDPQSLATSILETLEGDSTRSAPAINLSGAMNTASYIRHLL
jgi:predicted glycosyltransferase